MKKYLFLILVSSLVILLLLYFYDEREDVLNKEYVDDNIHVEYPYFNNYAIDSYINSYLGNIINNYDEIDNSLFIDYDYIENDGIIDLAMYVYKESSKIVRDDVSKFIIDTESNKINSIDDVLTVDSYYDVYKQRIIDKDKPMVALTFDDGPNHNTSKVLDILTKYNVKATFFILGSNVEGHEDIIKRMNDLGMEIGNHMYSHKLVTGLENEELKEEINKVDDLVFDVIGRNPTLIRPSYGTFNKRVKSIVDRPIIIWNVDTLDWKYHNSKKISNRVFKSVSDGDIILMHDIYSATANSLEITIPKLLEMGYQLVTVSDLFYHKEKELIEGNVYGGISLR